MGGIGDAIAEGIVRLIILMFITGFALGGLLVWGLPKLWEVIKPFIHMWTA